MYPAIELGLSEEERRGWLSIRQQGREIDRLVETLRSSDAVAPAFDAGVMELRGRIFAYLSDLAGDLLRRVAALPSTEQEALVERYVAIKAAGVAPMVSPPT